MLLSNPEYLRLIATALTSDVLPSVAGKAPQAALLACVDGLRELVDREARLPAILDEAMPCGRALMDRLSVFPAFPQEGRNIEFSTDAAGLSHLLSRLDAGAKWLADHRPAMPTDHAANATAWLKDVALWELGYYSALYGTSLPDLQAATVEPQALTEAKLQRLLAERLDDATVSVADFERIPGGFANETIFFTLGRSGDADRQLVVRKNPPEHFFDFWAHRVREEFEIVRRVADAGLPVPKPLWLFTDVPDVDGDFYIMTRGAGHMVGTLRGANETLPETLLLSLAEFLAKLHAIPLERFADYMATGDTPVTPGDTIHSAVSKNVEFIYTKWTRAQRLPSPAEAFTIDWLRRNVPANANRPVVVHTDCFVHNFLVEEDRIETVVDWEAAHFGDPAEDLAYIKAQVSRHMNWQRFLDHYRACGGQPINESSLDYYNCLLNFRNYFGTNLGVARVPRGVSDVRMIALGSEYFTLFMRACVEAATGTITHSASR